MVQTQLQDSDKTPSPQPFEEPDNMVTIELNKKGYFGDEEKKSDKTKCKIKFMTKIVKPHILRLSLLILGSLCLAMLIIIVRGYLKTSNPTNADIPRTRGILSKNIFSNKTFSNACKESKTFEDCCYIVLKTDLFSEMEKCTVDKVLNLFLQYELEANKRSKRQSYDYANYVEQIFKTGEQQADFTDYQSDPYQSEHYYVENDYYQGYGNIPSEQYEQEPEFSANYNNLYYDLEKQQNDHLYEKVYSSSTTSRIEEMKEYIPPVVTQKPDPIVQAVAASTVLPKTCPDDNCPSVVNVTTRIANITDINAQPKTFEVNMNNTNIKISSKASQRISQGVEFDKSNMEIQTSSQSKQVVNPCFYPSGPFIPPYSAPNNQLFPMMPMNGQRQPLYVINPPMYPYIQMQYPGYPHPAMINRNPVPVQGPGGQYYMCNPMSSNNVVGLPGVEVRSKADMSSLQDLVESTPKSTNNKTREAIDCPFGEHSCSDGSKCIHERKLCDNEVDCNDGSDEMNCSCKSRVWEMRLCDGYLDCPDGEDEQECFDCDKDEFSCDDWSRFRRGTCVPLHQRCDGIKQCEITGKDEEDCSILTDHIGQHSFNKISNAAGFLHRNYKGQWFPTCLGADFFATDVCKTEAGPSGIAPKSQLVASNDNYPGLFIEVSTNMEINLVDSCMGNKAAFVECPPIFCGLRLTISNPFRASEVDTSAEEILNHARFSKETVGSPRVVGGKPSQPAAWPWAVSIYKNGFFHCGGVLINELWIVTAAHCIDRFWFFYYEIQAGALRRFSYSPTEQSRWAVAAIPHEDYSKKSLKNDIALMKLSKPVRFNRHVRPICLPSETTAGEDFLKGPKVNTVCVTVGWGATVEHGSDPDHLREVEVPILSHCKHTEDEEGDEICAGLMEGGRDACQGDSGGPLMCQNEKNRSQWYLAGIVSHGEGCARPNEPGAYTKVSKYVGWIGENINGKGGGRVPLQKCPGYICKGTKRCLPKKRHCDKIVDCLFGDDESNCGQNGAHSIFNSRAVGSAQPRIFSKVIDLLTLDDNSSEDKSDEEEIAVKRNESKTAKLPKLFTCKNLLQVIPFEEKCNKVVNCEDGTDESDCLCADHLRSYHPEAICDGVTDCKDLSDESDCLKCLPEEHLCRLRQKCIPLKNRCDGKADCFRSEDEWDCVALTDGGTLVLDSDLRPKQSMKGIITINRFGVWRPLCTNASTDEAASIATNACNLLGFEKYTEFHKLSVTDKPLNVTIDAFQRNQTSLDYSVVCGGLFVGCLEANIHQLHPDNITTQVELYTSPWNAVIYSDGKFRCTGTILTHHWIITTKACLGETLPKNAYLAVLLGKGKAHLDVEGPHEQAIPITGITPIEESDAIILRTQEKINFNRYVKPTQITARTVFIKEKCVAIGFENKRSQFVFLQSKKCSPGFRCFESVIDFCKETPQTWNGIITCNSREGWYPAAVFNDINGPCDFSKRKFPSIDRIKVQRLMDKTPENIFSQECDGFRCNLGLCIEKNKVCNGIPDCRDEEDEDLNLCSKSEICKWTEFKCRDGTCIPKSSFCDTVNDCGDFYDEPAICSCKSYLERVHPEKICDGTVNCWDRSDENPRKCKCHFPSNVTCGQTHFCVSKEMVCDGFRDCPGGEDESTCYSLRTNFSVVDRGEVMRRTAGVWHSGCFTRNHTTSELEEICQQLGFAGGSATELQQQNMDQVTMNPVKDRFDVVWIRRSEGNKLKLRLRTGNEPYLKFTRDAECHKLFIECL